MDVKQGAYNFFNGIKLLRISCYAVLATVFYSKIIWKECFFIGKTKENQKFQYQQSYKSYKSYMELQN